MEAYKKDFIHFISECGALKFGSFTLKSGRTSPFFMNAGEFTSGLALKKLGTAYAKAIHAHYGEDFEVLFGPAYKGIAIAAATCQAFYELYSKAVHYSADRKEVKDHGADAGGFLAHKILDGERVIITEDVTTSGKSIDEVVPKIQSVAKGAIILGEVVMIDRMEKVSATNTQSATSAIKAKWGFGVHAIVTMEEVIEELYDNGKGSVITSDIKKALDDYYKEWGAK